MIPPGGNVMHPREGLHPVGPQQPSLRGSLSQARVIALHPQPDNCPTSCMSQALLGFSGDNQRSSDACAWH